MNTSSNFDTAMTGKERVCALLNAPLIMSSLDLTHTSVESVTTCDRSSTNSQAVVRLNLTAALAEAIRAGFVKPNVADIKRTIFIQRLSGGELHHTAGVATFGININKSSTDTQIIDAVNTAYNLGLDALDILVIERNNDISKIIFKVNSLSYTGSISVQHVAT